jgi:hypothetical protein
MYRRLLPILALLALQSGGVCAFHPVCAWFLCRFQLQYLTLQQVYFCEKLRRVKETEVSLVAQHIDWDGVGLANALKEIV